MQCLPVENGITSGHVLGVLHNHSHVFFVANVHEAARCQLVLAQHFEKDFDRGFAYYACNLSNSLSGVCQNRLVLRARNLL